MGTTLAWAASTLDGDVKRGFDVAPCIRCELASRCNPKGCALIDDCTMHHPCVIARARKSPKIIVGRWFTAGSLVQLVLLQLALAYDSFSLCMCVCAVVWLVRVVQHRLITGVVGSFWQNRWCGHGTIGDLMHISMCVFLKCGLLGCCEFSPCACIMLL